MIKVSKIILCVFMAFAVMIASCPSPEKDDNSEGDPDPDITDQKTTIVFNNTQGTCTAVVYSNIPRNDNNIIAVIPAGQLSDEIEWPPGASVPFFFSYNYNLVGISTLTLDYIADLGKDQTHVRVDENKKTVIPVPTLNDVVSPPDKLLTNNSYIYIQNNSSFTVSFVRGSTVLQPDNFSSTGVNPGEQAQYTISGNDNRNVSLYNLIDNAVFKNIFGLTTFAPGLVYSFVYDGNDINLFSVLEIKLDNVVLGSQDDPVNKTWVRFENDNLFPVTVFSDRQRQIKLTDIAAESHVTIQTDPNISGAIYYPNYQIVIEDIRIPYEGAPIIWRIDAGRTEVNPIVIPIISLEDIGEEELQKPFADSAYIKIQNMSSFSMSMRRGTNNLFPAGSLSPVVNGGESVYYIINQGSVQDYSIMRNPSTRVDFPAGLTLFESGKLYSFRFDGSKIDLLTEKDLTIAQVFALCAPENIAARTLPSGYINLSWEKAGIENSYRIYRAQESPDDFIFLASTHNMHYTDNTVVLGNTYFYKLKSVRGSMEGEISSNYASALAEISPLLAPTEINVSVQGMSSISLSWNSVEDAAFYLIHRGSSSSDVNTLVTITASTSFTVTGLNINTEYWFTLTAANNYTESNPSQAVRAFIAVAPLLAPAEINVSVQGLNSISLSWNSVEDATFYIIHRGSSSSNVNTLVTTTMSTSFTVSDLNINTEYWFTVTAANNYIESYPSQAVRAFIAAATVSFDSQGGSSVSSQTVIIGSKLTEPVKPVRSAHNFDGWFRQAAYTTEWNFNTDTVSGNITLYAKWTKGIIEMVRINAGTFTMGSPTTEGPNRGNSEGPQRQVTLSSFYIGKYLITQEQYLSVMGTNPSSFKTAISGENAARLPVDNVSWLNAIEFCNRLSEEDGLTPVYTDNSSFILGTQIIPNWSANGYRLPTEAEWEYACRAGTTTAYNTGAVVSDNTGWYSANSGHRTREVGKKPPNAWGLYDMHGNLMEWTWDWWAASYPNVNETNPRGPASGNWRAQRGGSYQDGAGYIRSASRQNGALMSLQQPWFGFRVVRNFE